MIELLCVEVSDYAGLRKAIRARVEQLNISRVCLDEVAGLPTGYSGKILSEGEAKDAKRIGPLSLELLLKATGLKLLLVDDREQLAKVEPMLEQRDATQVRLNNHCRRSKGHRKAKPKSASRMKKPAGPKRGKPYLSERACIA